MAQQNRKNNLSRIKAQVLPFIRSVWFFPALLVAALILLTALQVNGSSVGSFYSSLYGKLKNPHLIAGHPQAIRSDEWEVNTPITISQAENGYPRINPDIGNGQDMSIVLDVPYKEWSVVFKPQNLAFFIMPVAFAFAFKWWLLGALLMLACYVFTLKLLPKRYALASFVSVGLFFSPFVQWWYQSATILPLAYGLAIAALGMYLLGPSLSRKRGILLSALLAYTLVCFSLILYVPFILPVAIVLGAFLVGHFCNTFHQKDGRKYVVKRLLYFVPPLVVALAITGVFILTRPAPIAAISDSVYPGHRTAESGEYSFKQLAGGYFNMQLQSGQKALHAPANQSETSNFIYLFPLILPAILFVMWRKRLDRRAIDWRIVALAIVAAVFAVRLFVPFSDGLFSLLQLNRVPHNRLLIGFGLLNVMLIVLGMRYLDVAKEKVAGRIVRWSTLGTFIAVTWLGMAFRSTHPGYLDSRKEIVLIALAISIIVWLFLKKRFAWSMALLALFSILSTASVNPLYRGLYPVQGSKLSQAMEDIGDKRGGWVVSNNAEVLENVTLANGLRSLSGVYAYPQNDVWKSLGEQKAQKDVYNRYAHVFFTIEPIDNPAYPAGAYLDPPALDAFRVHADPCSSFLKERRVRYVISATDLSSSTCVTQIREVVYPALSLKIYEIR